MEIIDFVFSRGRKLENTRCLGSRGRCSLKDNEIIVKNVRARTTALLQMNGPTNSWVTCFMTQPSQTCCDISLFELHCRAFKTACLWKVIKLSVKDQMPTPRNVSNTTLPPGKTKQSTVVIIHVTSHVVPKHFEHNDFGTISEGSGLLPFGVTQTLRSLLAQQELPRS